jgi:hypothetical protein
VTSFTVTLPDFKRFWIRVLQRVHPGAAIDKQDVEQGEEFTQPATPPLSPKRSPMDEPEAVGILWAACAVVCLLLYVIVDVLHETLGRNTAFAFLVMLTASVLWWITKRSRIPGSHKARWVAAVASGMILIGISLFDGRPRNNPLFQSARAATAQSQTPPVVVKDSPRPAKTLQTTAAVVPRSEPGENLGVQLGRYIEGAKNQVAQKWSSSEVAAGTPAGATVYIQFAIRQRGTHEVPTMETSSGYPSLDASCLRAVERIRTFDHLPRRYSGESLIVLYHCTYPGSSTTTFAQDSISQTVQQPPVHGSVDAVHGGQQLTKGAVVTN